jgi:hypothetical protein
VRLARAAVPAATFLDGDFSQLQLEDGSSDAVTAFYPVSHLALCADVEETDG